MMRKIIFVLYFIFCLQLVVAQRSASFNSSNRLFYEGKAMFDDKNYAGCIDKLREYRKIAQDPDLIQETEFLLVSSAYRQGVKGAGQMLKDYLDTYPETRHYDETCFMIGSTHFSGKDYQVAIFWLNKANLDNLSETDQEDYAYRVAYSCFETNKKDDARRLFGLLKDNSVRYKDAATYYYAHLLYQDGDYNAALPLFGSLKDKPDYKPEALYYLAQINYMQKRYSQTISDGKTLLNNYPDHKNTDEANRLVGASSYYEGDYESAARYLTAYVEKNGSPLRNDLYMLGLSYYNLKVYKDAVTYLGKSISGNDGLGQNSYLYLGQSYLKLGDNKNALMAFEAASRMNFDAQVKEASMYNYAVLLHQTSPSAFGESVTVLENFLNQYPNSRYADKINDCLVEVYLTTKNYDTALKSIEKIKNPGTKILEAKQKIFYHLGTVYFTNTDYTKAIDYFTKAFGAGNYAPAEKEKALYWRAESYFRKNDFNNAIRDYKAFIQSGGSRELTASANYGLGYCYFNQHQYSSAQSYFSDYINKETDNSKMTLADAYARTGDCYFYNRQFSEAEKAYSKSATLQPSMADYTIFQQGFLMGLQKNYSGKITQMDKLVASYPDSRYVSDAIYEKGRAYVMMENSQAAIQAYESLLSKYPETEVARKAAVQIALLYFNLDQPEKAQAAYKKVVEKYPGSEEARVAVQDLKSVYVELNDVAGYAHYVNSLGGATKFEVTEQDSLTYLAAERFFMKGDVKQAQDAIKKYLQSFPDGAFNVNAHYYLGNIYYNQEQDDAAIAEFKQVLDAGDTKFTEDALIYISEIYYQRKEYEAALGTYQRLQSMATGKGNKDTALTGILRSAAQLDKYTEMLNASNALLKEAKLEPEINTEATYYRAKAYMGLKENAKAVTDLQTLSKDTRTAFGAEAKYLLAQYYFDNKEPNKAEAEVTDYIKKGTPHSYWLARGFILLSDVYESKKDYLQAKQYLESLQHNYTNRDDGIYTMITDRLEKLKAKN